MKKTELPDYLRMKKAPPKNDFFSVLNRPPSHTRKLCQIKVNHNLSLLIVNETGDRVAGFKMKPF
jgi:hypothetical protein